MTFLTLELGKSCDNLFNSSIQWRGYWASLRSVQVLSREGLAESRAALHGFIHHIAPRVAKNGVTINGTCSKLPDLTYQARHPLSLRERQCSLEKRIKMYVQAEVNAEI